MANAMLVLLGQCSRPSCLGSREAEPPARAWARKVRSSLQRGIIGLGIRNHVEAEFGKIHGLLKGSDWEARQGEVPEKDQGVSELVMPGKRRGKGGDRG